ncbi:hypothetical protein HRI_005030900 [Hibiscus trionum]|uniref:Integrase catalytic domain-containing protein n=1 Tax=Hibiscus trionum TaxID=183268 RepID=A0A9W7MUE0_HIBTR|nr:hypothetical protein HRI_005030900 [Hibiscus trionum]
MKHKSDVLTIVPSFITMIKTQLGYELKIFRSDNAPELRFVELFSRLGIVHQFTCVETPQQNSVDERKHQHLLAVVRALFFHARVPLRFWGECILTATFLINRLPSRILGDQSPYELLHSHKPSYSCLKVFGSLCFVSTLKSQRDKFSERVLPGVFLGYVPGVKGYKVYILQTRAIVVSRNVVFHEDIFPFHKITPLDDLVDPFPGLSLPSVVHVSGGDSGSLKLLMCLLWLKMLIMLVRSLLVSLLWNLLLSPFLSLLWSLWLNRLLSLLFLVNLLVLLLDLHILIYIIAIMLFPRNVYILLSIISPAPDFLHLMLIL